MPVNIMKTILKKYDVVIADVPCSGLGVISKKPDINMHFKKKRH